MARVDDQAIDYFIKAPTSGRASFAIVRRNRDTGKSTTLKNPQVTAVNSQFHSGLLDKAQATEALRREIDRLRLQEFGSQSINLLPANEKILENYWDTVYAHRELESEASAYNRLRRAVLALGDTPLTADRETLQKAVNSAAQKLRNTPKRAAGKNQREIVSALNQILKHMGRPNIKLTRFKKVPRAVKYVTHEELEAISRRTTDPELRCLFWVAFTTGCRAGEIFALTPEKYRPKDSAILVDSQREIDWNLKYPKTRKIRTTAVLAFGIPWLNKWFAIPEEQKKELRKKRHSDFLREAANLALDNAKPNLVLHDLRHSYAIYLLNRGVPIDLVAQALGDNIQVVQENYVGFVLTQEGIKRIAQIVG